MHIFTVTCDGRAAALVRAGGKAEAIAIALDLAEQRNLLGLVAGPRRFEARLPSAAELAQWQKHHAHSVILDEPVAA